jgi:hypothetical protein
MITGNGGRPGYEVLNAQSRTTEIANMLACNKHTLQGILQHMPYGILV